MRRMKTYLWFLWIGIRGFFFGVQVSDTPNQPEDVLKLLDNGYTVVLYRNDIGSITAKALKSNENSVLKDVPDRRITDDFTVGQVLYRLTEKVTTGRIA